MNKHLSSIGMSILCLLSCTNAFASESSYSSDKDLSIKEIVKNHYNDNLYVGMAIAGKSLDALSGEIAKREFDYMTPANDFKQSYAHPIFKTWRWDIADNWIDFSKKHNVKLRIHGPISPQCSKWVKDDNLEPVEMEKMLDEYMTNLCVRYGNKPEVKWMDVINETIAKGTITDSIFGKVELGDWFSARKGVDLWENPWTKLGYDESSDIRVPLYIGKAFKICTQYAPNVKLIINQHGNFEGKVWEKIKILVKYLREKGYRVDGLGWQAHIDCGWELKPGNVERLDKFVKWCHENNLEFHITEMNVWIKDKDKQNETLQADTYRTIISTLLKHVKSGKVGICFWNVRDEDTGRPKWAPCLWRNDGSARPAYYEIKKELINNKLK